MNTLTTRVRRARAQIRKAGRTIEGANLQQVERNEVVDSLDDILDEARRQRARLRQRRP